MYNDPGRIATLTDHGPDHMIELTINGEPRTLAQSLTVAQLVEQLGYDRRKIAVEVNREVVPLPRHPEQQLATGDAVEIVTLVGGGGNETVT